MQLLARYNCYTTIFFIFVQTNFHEDTKNKAVAD